MVSFAKEPGGSSLARALRGVRSMPPAQPGVDVLSRARRVRVRHIRWMNEDQRRPWVSARVEVDARAFDDVAFSRDEAGRPRLAEPRAGSRQPGWRFEGELKQVLLRIADLVLPPLRPLRPRRGPYAGDPRPRCSWEALMQARRASHGRCYTWDAVQHAKSGGSAPGQGA